MEYADINVTEQLANDERALQALTNLRAIIGRLAEMGIPPERYAISPSLARGLSYYTGCVFEAVVDNPPMGSLLGGGRYDELVGMFAGRPIPTVGLAFGIERLHDVMEELGLGPVSRTIPEVFVTIFSQELAGEALRLASELRASGLKVEVALDPGDKLGKQLKYADQRHIPFAVVIGPDELTRGEIVVKDLRSGNQRSIARDQAAAQIHAAR